VSLNPRLDFGRDFGELLVRAFDEVLDELTRCTDAGAAGVGDVAAGASALMDEGAVDLEAGANLGVRGHDA
jgi:hypothetical protein